MHTKDILRQARQLIEQGWVQGTWAISADRIAVSPTDVRATCFCSIGAVVRAAKGDESEIGIARSRLLVAVGTDHIASWNDDPRRTKDEVLAAFDKAIEVA